MGWLLLLAFFLLLFAIPVGYGWGYRGWGPPRYRRPLTADERARLAHQDRATDETWGVLAVLVWTMFLVSLVWFLVLVF